MMNNVLSKKMEVLSQNKFTGDMLDIKVPTLVMIDNGNLLIRNDVANIYICNDQMAVLTEPGEYYLERPIDCMIHTQSIHGSTFSFSGNFVTNLADCSKAVCFLNKELPLFGIADSLVTMAPSNLDVMKNGKRDELFTYRNTAINVIHSHSESMSTTTKDIVYDAIVIGAGPYGCSAAFTLINEKKSVYWVGESLSFWLRNTQPTPLRSVKAATNIYVGTSGYTFIDFCNMHGIDVSGKIEFWEFLAYYFYLLTEFDAFPAFEKTTNVFYANNCWNIELVGPNGIKTIKAHNVINATGIGMHEYVPAMIDELPKKIACHVSSTATQAFPENKDVAVIGGGQSAIEYALQADSMNNNVTLYVRGELHFRNLHEPREFIYRYLATHCENIIVWLPVRLRTRLLNYLLEGTCDPDVQKELESSTIELKEHVNIRNASHDDNDKAVLITNDSKRAFDMAIAATGYYYNIHDVKYLSSVIDPCRHVMAERYPKLNGKAMLKNAPRGLYFTGFACMYSIGFKAQFINGSNIVIKRIVDDIKNH